MEAPKCSYEKTKMVSLQFWKTWKDTFFKHNGLS